MPSRILWIVRIVRPRIDTVSLRVINIKDLYLTFPNRLALKRLFHWHSLNVLGKATMQLTDHVLQFLNVIHDAAFTKSATVQKSLSIPANIAGVIFKLPCVRTRL